MKFSIHVRIRKCGKEFVFSTDTAEQSSEMQILQKVYITQSCKSLAQNQQMGQWHIINIQENARPIVIQTVLTGIQQISNLFQLACSDWLSNLLAITWRPNFCSSWTMCMEQFTSIFTDCSPFLTFKKYLKTYSFSLSF